MSAAALHVRQGPIARGVKTSRWTGWLGPCCKAERSDPRNALLQPDGAIADNEGDTMRHRIVLLLTTVCIHTQAQTAAALAPPCDRAVRFSAAWFPDPVVDNSKSAAELTKMDFGGAAPKGGEIQLGHVVVETKLAVIPQTSCQGVIVRLDYIKPVLRVASEFPLNSCAYARVMNHEQTHVRIHRDIASQFRELHYPWRIDGNGTAILNYAKQELQRLMRAQAEFDSPQEYSKNHTVCGGEIARLVKLPAQLPKSGPKSS